MACLKRSGKNDGSSECLANQDAKRKSIIQIYTDWANHYLERGRYKRNIQDLQTDINDGVMLADVIEAVIGKKVPGVQRKPKNISQMVENITLCLNFVSNLGVPIEGVTPKDVKEGNLKVILSLFFNLSRYKQEQKNVTPENGILNNTLKCNMVAAHDMLSKLPSPFRQCTSSRIKQQDIPSSQQPSTRIPQNDRCNRIVSPSIVAQGYVGIGAKGPPSADSSRSGSPHTTTPSPLSFIPQPKSAVTRERIGFDKSRSRPSSTSSNSSIPHLPIKSNLGSTPSIPKCSSGRNLQTAINNVHSSNPMLDKLKFISSRDRTAERPKVISSNKRTSSSSGFSSARSERSDSSTSICSDSKLNKCASPEGQPFSKAAIPSLNCSSSIPSKGLVKKINCLPGTKQLANKTRTADGKDSVSSKIDELKCASRIAKERRNEKRLKSETTVPKPTASDNCILKNQIHSPTYTNFTEIKTDKEKVFGQYNVTDSEKNVIPKLEVVSNLKDKILAIPNSASHNASISSNVLPNEKLLQDIDNSIVTSTSLPTMDYSSAQQGNSLLMASTGNSSIPKPTAAVKGTSKITKDTPNSSNPDLTINPKNPEKHPLQGTKLARDEIYVAVHIAGPDTQVLDTGQPIQMETRVSSLPKTRADNRGNSQGSVSIAMVSPIMSSSHGKKEDEKSNNQKPSSTTNCKPNLGMKTNAMPIYETCDKLSSRDVNRSETAAIAEEGDDVILNIKPMQPLLRASPYGYMRNLGPTRTPLAARMHSTLRAQAEYGENVRTNSNKQFLDNARMYGIAMKRALTGCNSLVDANPDQESYDASGYMSDGEVLRPGIMYRSDDVSSGYMSEGGTRTFTRRAVARFKENSKETGIINVLQDDRHPTHAQRHLNRLRLDDSSSVSSGVSDTFPELSTDDNLTGSSISSDNNVYGSLKRSPRTSSQLHSHKSSAAEKHRNIPENHATYVASGTNNIKTKQAHVKKTDSSMQTESSAFHHVSGSSSSSTWKKYMLHQNSPQAHSYDSERNIPSEKPSKDLKKSSKGDSKKSIDSHKSSKQNKLSSVRSTLENDIGRCGSKGGSCESLTASSAGNKKSSRPSAVAQATSGASLKRSNAQTGAAQTQYYASCNGAAAGGAHGAYGKPSGHRNLGSGPQHRNSSEKLSECNSTRISSGEHSDMSQCYGRPSPVALVSNATTTKSVDHQQQRKGKAKVSANTQTNSNDLCSPSSGIVHSDSEYSSLGRKYPPKQYFMTTPGPGTGLKERMYGTRSALNGSPTPMSDYMMLSSGRAPRLSGPMRDLDNYASLDHGPYSWMRHSPSCGTSVISSSAGVKRAGTLTEADSMESLSSTSSSIHAQIQHARANSLTHARLMLHQRELASSPRLSRSNSIRSTKSEKLPSYLLQRSTEEAESHASIYQQPNGICNASNNSQPTSPSSAPQGSNRYMYPLSPGTTSLSNTVGSVNQANSRCSMSPYVTGLLSKINSKDDDIHGSALSLVSTNSSIYSTAEEKQAHEIRKLKRELDQSHEKVATLTSQLTTNAHMVAAFEQSLSNMTNRLQHLTATAEQKDSELIELRQTIEALKQQSAEAGLTKMALQSMQAVQRTLQEHRISRQFSTDSVSSVNSYSSACSGNSGQSADPLGSKKKKKKGWLRSSFSKAFSRSKKNKNGSVSDVEDMRHLQSDSSTPNSPLLGIASHMISVPAGQATLKLSHSSSDLYEQEDEESAEFVKELKKQLREKDMVLTDIRLDALSSAHQLESLKETVNKMRSEMSSLKQDNDRLQRLVSTKSLTSSQNSLPLHTSLESLEKRLSSSEQCANLNDELYLKESRSDHDGKLVTVSVYLGCHGDSSYYQNQTIPNECFIGNICINSKTQWDLLDNLVKRTLKEYVLRVDPVSNLGLGTESAITYHIGEIVRSKEAQIPELLPFGYVVGDSMNIKIVLKGTKQHCLDALAFESLIPKSIIQRYISLLTEHRRIILCGPSGTGKTYTAQKLAEYLVLRNGKELSVGAIATFSVDHKSAKELRQYLSNVADQCETSNVLDLPTVIILDNLHHVGSLGEVFNGFLSAKYQKCPYIIGTMNQATCSTTNLQLHHNFRWVLCANHMEPVKGFLGRYLKRKLIEEEVKNGLLSPDIAKVIDWMPQVWQHLNKYLETHSSSDVTIGPRLFLSCPVDMPGSQVWFTDLWNYSIVPYLLEAVREGLQLYGRRAPWEDPVEWVYETYPWSTQGPNSNDWPQLLHLRPEDVGYEGHPGPTPGTKTHFRTGNDSDTDPLLNMLMRLQEAASYSSPHSNDSDSTSMDSHGSGMHSDELLNSGLESTL